MINLSEKIFFCMFHFITDDIRIDFSSKSDHDCPTSLNDIPDEDALTPWPPAIISGETVFSARIGPTGGKRGYTPITGMYI